MNEGEEENEELADVVLPDEPNYELLLYKRNERRQREWQEKMDLIY
jgi:hypothetical protein